MLTAEKAKHEIEMLTIEANDPKCKISRYKRIGKLVERLNDVLAYLANNPQEEYIKSEVTRLRALILKITHKDNFELWKVENKADAACDNPQGKYDRIMELAKHRRHLKNAEFILNG